MVTYIKNAFIVLLILLPLWSAGAQDVQTDYLKAKQYLQEEKYTFAIEQFRKLAAMDQQHPFKAYASFYYGLAAYKNGDLGLARSVWLQMTTKNKDWKQIDEVYFWLSKVYFEEQNWTQGVAYSKRSKVATAEGMMFDYLTQIESLSELMLLQARYPNDKQVAFATATVISQQPYSQRDFVLLNRIVKQFGFKSADFGLIEIGESELKLEYNVAVLLPFMFESLENTSRVMRNKFVMDLYQGILQALDTLNSVGKPIKIFPYDTKRNSELTQSILSKPEMKGMDLIIGPLFPKPSKIANDFSFENKINIINPIISNSNAIGNNPYSFLYKADIETKALTAAQLVIDSVDNKYAMVFYEDNPKDSLSAYTYSQKIMEAGFEVLMTAPVVDSTVSRAYTMLTEKYEVGYTEGQVDSLLTLDEVHDIKERKSTITKDSVEYYEEFFVLAPDSIGHIYVASSKALIASNFVSALSIRDDSTVLIGRGDWMNIGTLTFKEMERLGIYFIDPNYLKETSDSYLSFRTSYVRNHKVSPSMNVMIGYDMMYYIGNMLHKYGNYYQNGNPVEGFTSGQLFYGMDYRLSNSNQFVPITQFKDAQLRVVNKKNDEQVK